jgi:Domain of unknown function (DUF6379)
LTSLAVVDLTLDGERIPTSELTVEANGETLAFDELQHRYDDWWFTTDAVTLRIPRPKGRGSSHRVQLDLGLRIPYLIVGGADGEPLLASSHTDKTLVCT